MSLFIITSAKADGRIEFKDDESVGFVICFALWPLTLVMILMITLFEMYKNLLKKEVMGYIPDTSRLDTQLDNLNVKQLKMVLRAERIGAIHLSEKAKEQASKIIIDRSFEENFLGKK